MNMLKRSLAMLLVLTLLFSFVPFSVFADDGESAETTAVTEAVEQRSGGPGNSDFGHSQGNGKDKHKHKDPLKETEAPEVTEAPTETTVPETTVPETTVPETTVPETTVPETTVPETTVPETTVPETTVPETTVPETTVPETTVPETTVPETTVPETEPLIRCMLSDAELNVASTDGVYTGTVEAPDEFLKVFHLDVGRKYFTVDQVKAILDLLGEKGYSHMELAIGNDGLRFLLDDMSVTVGETTYDSATVTAGVKAGNAAYDHAGEWTQADMDTIIAYAKTKGIEIIPLVNTPGHMDSILAAMKDCGIDGYYEFSKRTVDLENAEAVAFTQTLVMKYAAYFASKGCNYFNIGADEYANDYHTNDQTGMGFGQLVTDRKYNYFIDYVNELVQIITAKGMTPIAFNDGIYYDENVSFGTFDTRLVIAYWSAGWGGIKPASSDFLAGKKHLILNTNERWYYVLGRTNTTYGYNSNAYPNAQYVGVTTVVDNKTVSPIGAMQCVWCDEPYVDYSSYQDKVQSIISTLAANNSAYFTGPNVVEPEEPEETQPTTPSEPEVTEPTPVVDEDTKVGVTAAEVKSIQVAAVENLPVIDAAAEGKVVAFDVTPKTENGADYIGEATVSIPVSAEWTNVRGGVLASDHGGEVMGIQGELKDGMFTFTVPHFSTVVAYDEDRTYVDAGSYLIGVGESVDIICGAEGDLNVAVQDAAVATVTTQFKEVPGETERERNSAVSMNSNGNYKGLIYNGTYYLVMDASGNISSTQNINEATEFTVVRDGVFSHTYTISNGSKYLSVSNSKLTSSDRSYDWSYSSGFQVSNSNRLVCPNGTWTLAGSGNGNRGNLYSYTEETTYVERTVATVTGNIVGTTYVTIGDNRYIVNVIAESLNVTPIKVEWWITNIKVDATDGTVHKGTITYDGGDGGNDQDVKYSEITAEAAYGENGVPVADYVPKTAKWAYSDALYFWKGAHQTIANYQTAQSGDMTGAGNDFYYVRYYQSKWWVSLDRTDWWEVDVDNKDKLVAYYLQKQKVTDEVDVYFKDWGYNPGESDGSTNQVGLSVAVVYPDGSMSSTEDEIYLNSTVTFNYWANRDIGIVSPANNTTYEISKITVTNGTRSGSGVWSDTTNQVTWDKVTNEAGSEWYDERTVWTADEEDRDANDTAIPMVNGAANKDNVIWPSVNSAVLVLIYLDTIEYDNNLIVRWVDDSAQSALIHEMQVNITTENTTTNFYKELKQTSLLPAENVGGSFTLDDDAYVINSSNKKQTFNKDITIIQNVAAQYKSGLYYYVGADLDAAGGVLTLHYNINPKKLAPMYVVDFGLPMKFPITDLVDNPDDMDSVEFIEQPKYGTAELASNEITYTPTSILQAIDVLPIKVTFNNGNYQTVRVGIAPATTVYYEESFLNYDTSWSERTVHTETQKTEKLGKSSHYGYDDAYGLNDPYGLNQVAKTSADSTANGATASFSFTGTGFELYANSTPTSGIVTVYSEGKVSKLYMIDTELNSENSAGAENAEDFESAGIHYGLPIISETDLTYGNYTVQLRQTNGDENIYIDGVRIVNTLHPDTTVIGDNNENVSIYLADEEDYPAFYELRDYVLNALNVDNNTSKDYGTLEQMKNQVYAGISNNGEAPANAAVVLSNKAEINAQDLLDNGPKNELYLYPGSSLTFSFKTDRVAQLGLKAPVGNATFTVKETVNNETKTLDLSSLSTTVDMFYKIANKGSASSGMTVTISVSDGVLSVTDLKICDDPNAALLPLTLADIENTLVNVYGFSNEETPVEPPVPETPTKPSKPVEPTEPEKPTEPEVEETKPTKPGKPEKPEKPEKPAKPGQNKPGKPAEKQKDAKLKITYVNLLGKKVGSATLTKTGTANQRCTFSASEIIGNAPAGRNALWFLPVVSAYGSNVSIIVPVI